MKNLILLLALLWGVPLQAELPTSAPVSPELKPAEQQPTEVVPAPQQNTQPNSQTNPQVNTRSNSQITPKPPAKRSASIGPIIPTVKAVYPHDVTTFTQGLEFHNGKLYESGGMYGQSVVRIVEPSTGEVIRNVSLQPAFFAEGLTILKNIVYQITWREETAFAYNAEDLSLIQEFTYTGEGWGLTNDGTSLIMSNGSDTLTWRDPNTFLAERQVRVSLRGNPVAQLNELEYVNGKIYANIFMQDVIVKINPTTGEVEKVINADKLYPAENRDQQQVLNGIAWNPESKTFFLTGKYWPSMFEVTLEE
ncbi:MAG: glutaminyl-peptide cyclotransferase [Sumerlaeia bacterium]